MGRTGAPLDRPVGSRVNARAGSFTWVNRTRKRIVSTFARAIPSVSGSPGIPGMRLACCFGTVPQSIPRARSASADREIAQLVILIATYNLNIFMRLDNWKKKLIFRLVSLFDY